MRRFVASSVIAAAALAVGSSLVFAQPKPPADAAKPQTDVPVKVAVLFSSGVGYFEHIGSVKGDASTELRFKTAQINDILKSLVLQDLGNGKVSSIVYPSQDPISKTLRSFQIDITGNPSLAEMLNQLRGAKVKVTAGTETLSATILGVEKKQKAVDKGQIDVWVMNLIAGATIRSIALDEVTKLDLEDPALQEELTKALSALAQSRGQDKKPVTINFLGEGERMVRVGYVVETPVWKTSYRLLISPKGDNKHGLQGWAIVENQTDNDWTDVQLSLVSGRPISFIQELYQPLYIPRPVVLPELFASLRPQTYDDGLKSRKQNELAEMDEALGVPGESRRAGAKGDAAPGRPAPAAPMAPAKREMDRLAEVANRPMDAAASVASVASAAKVGELFQYTVGNVSLPRQRSAMIPIITDPIEVEKLSIYNQNVLAKNPLNGARVKNTTKKHLLAGPITVLEGGTYAGDARIDNLPPNQERLLSYGVDLQVLVNASKFTNTSTIQAGKIVKGVLHISRKQVFTQDYVAENKDMEKDKTLIIEHHFRQGWKLVAPEKALETTETLYRFKQPLAAGKQAALTVTEEHVQWEMMQILPTDVGTLDFYSKTGQISAAVREALAKARDLKQHMVDSQRQVEARRAEINTIAQEQVRIRENIKTVPDKSTLKNRLLEKLEEQEKQIDDLYKRMDASQKQFERDRKDLEDYLNGLTVE